MLEIICLIWLWRVNGKHAIERGQNPKKYRALTLGLWFGLEFTGTFVGAWLMQLLNAGDNAFYGAYVFGIIGAAIGGFTSYWVAKKAPMGNYRPEDQPNGWNNQSGGWNQSQNGWDNQQNGWNQNQNSWDNQQNGWNQNQNSWDNQQNGWNQNGWDNQQNVWEQPQQEPDCLFAPATIHIIEEEGGYTGGQDAFFLNGRPICSLRPGSEYTFTTYAKKNVLTIGRPTPELSDETTALKFIAGEKGQIEIHACAGRLLPGKFSNYTA
ncbi:hypothetical protein [Coprococcus comes]|uniref:Uncharacterized protein n=1 Tax=Coprococcus comes TaxID=410072 RepID=A0A414U919_9FIRM|nr:hypothetical protein [Coprococcus comes]RHG58416.1 hypothetical protein DW252_13050 [Coprococcus comes]